MITDEEKDDFIKSKFQKDELISKKADDVFNNFFKEVQPMKENEELNNTEEIKNNNTKEFKSKHNGFRKFLATAASIVILFTGANVYATSQGYENIFFMIKYLVTGENSASGKDEILSDRDLTISFEEIKLTDKISVIVNKFQIQDGKAKLILKVTENPIEDSARIIPLEYKVTNEFGDELCYETSVKKDTLSLVEYTEELELNDFKMSDNILILEIYKADKSLITKMRINLEERTIEVDGEKEALEKISEIELKKFLGHVSGYYNLKESKEFEDDKIQLTHVILSQEGLISSSATTIKASDINGMLESLGFEKIPDSYKETKNSTYKVTTKNGEKYFEVVNGNDATLDGDCINVSDISYMNGTYSATYTYAFIGEGKIEDCDIYEATVLFQYDSNSKYSKFKLGSFSDSKIIQKASEEENTPMEPKNENTSSENNNPVDNNTSNNNDNNNTQVDKNRIEYVNKYNSIITYYDKTKINNYASTMSWTQYWAPGIKIQMPIDAELTELGGDKRGSRQGEISTQLVLDALGIDKEHNNEIVYSSLKIEIYEPLITKEDVTSYKYDSNGMEKCSYQSNLGHKWYSTNTKDENGDSVEEYNCITELTEGYYEIVKIKFITDNAYNYKITNIINWFLGNAKLTSY